MVKVRVPCPQVGDNGAIPGVPTVLAFSCEDQQQPSNLSDVHPQPGCHGAPLGSILVGFNFDIEYLRGTDNKVADVLSRVGDRLELDTDSIGVLLSHANDLMVPRAETEDPKAHAGTCPTRTGNHYAGPHVGGQPSCHAKSSR